MTLYIIDNDPTNSQVRRLVDSFGETVNRVVPLKATEWHEINEIKNDWYAIMYPREYLDERLTEALPIYLESDYDYLSTFKFDSGSRVRIYLSPRIFRNSVRLEEGSLQPVDAHTLRGVRVLDGWILEKE